MASMWVGEARDLRVPDDAVHGLRVLAGRDLRHPRVAAQVDVQLAPRRAGTRLLPYPALEVAAIGRGGVDVVPPAPDDAVERIGHPGRAVDGSVDPARELAPAGERGGLARRLRGGPGRRLDRTVAGTAARGKRSRQKSDRPDAPHGFRW